MNPVTPFRSVCAGAGALAVASLAQAHESHVGTADGWAAGLVHPILGADHLVALCAVAVWGAFCRRTPPLRQAGTLLGFAVVFAAWHGGADARAFAGGLLVSTAALFAAGAALGAATARLSGRAHRLLGGACAAAGVALLLA